ncbi:MAG: FtsQ-type POTRA domain-containing protein [Myxococcota bacterium]|nr:FtsQ-type POTRA domain-containing protein [Myxococcota bacterium]
MNWRGLRTQSGLPRHVTANRERGTRARSHLAKARERERRILTRRSRERNRRRTRGFALEPMSTRRRGAWLIGGLAFGLIAAWVSSETLWVRLGTELGAIESIAIQGQSHLNSASIAEATGVVRGSPLANVNPGAVEARLAALPWIEAADVLLLPPSTLLIRVHERIPRARLESSSATQLDRLVDAGGAPFDAIAADDSDWPLIRGSENLESNQPHAVLNQALELLARLQAAEFLTLASPGEPIALEIPRAGAPEGWIIHGRSQVILGRGDLSRRLDRLQQLVEAGLADSGNDVSSLKIDLRFDGQAVLAEAQPIALKGENG